ncbi:MAG: hypothetical protein ACOX2E_03310 [Syntrophaceticus sp.]|jgi:hypothetical protein
MAIIIIFGILTVLVIIGSWLYLRRQNPENISKQTGKTPGAAAEKKGKKPKKGLSVKDLWGIEDVKKGVIVMADDRYSLVCRMSAADFWLLSEADQNNIEDAAAAALAQLVFPVQFLTTAQAVDTREAVDELRIKAAGLPQGLREMAIQRAEYLSAVSKSKTASARQAYIVISFSTYNGFDYAYEELHARLALMASALAGANVALELLRSEAVVDLLAHILARDGAWRPSDVVENGALSLYIVPEKEVAMDDVS